MDSSTSNNNCNNPIEGNEVFNGSRAVSNASSTTIPQSTSASSRKTSSSSTSSQNEKKSRWKKNWSDLVTIRRRNLNDIYQRADMVSPPTSREAKEPELVKDDSNASIHNNNNVSLNNGSPSSIKNLTNGSAIRTLSRNKKLFGKSKMNRDDINMEGEEYIRQNYFPNHNNSLNNKSRNSEDSGQYIFNHNNNSSESSSILNNIINDQDNPVYSNNEFVSSYDGKVTEYRDYEAGYHLDSKSVEENNPDPRFVYSSFDDNYNGDRKQDDNENEKNIIASEHDEPKSHGKEPIRPTEELEKNENGIGDEFNFIDLPGNDQEIPGHLQTLRTLETMHQQQEVKNKQKQEVKEQQQKLQEEKKEQQTLPTITGIGSSSTPSTSQIPQAHTLRHAGIGHSRNFSGSFINTDNSNKSGDNKKKSLNPFSRMNPRRFLGNRSSSGNSVSTNESSIQTHPISSTPELNSPIGEASRRRERHDGGHILPTLNLGSLSRLNSPSNSPILGNHFESNNNNQIDTTNSNPNNNSSENEGTGNFNHQARVISRLIERSALSSIHNLIGQVNNQDGIRIDNRNRNRELSMRVPGHRFEDGSDSNFAEFILALQGNLLANELSNSVRMHMDRDRRRRYQEEQGGANVDAANDNSDDSNNNTSQSQMNSDDNTNNEQVDFETRIEPTAEDLRVQPMSFFRAFRFNPRQRPNMEDGEMEEQVPVLIIGVRSDLPGDNNRNNNNPNNENNSSENVTSPVTETNGSSPSVNSTDGNEHHNDHDNNRGGFFRNRNHRSRFRLENSRNSRRLEEIAQSYGQRRGRNHTRTSQRSWVLFVMGNSFPPDHAVLSAPTILSDNPTYEDLLALQAMLGRVKPLVATQEDVDRSGGLIKVHMDDDQGVRNSVIEQDASNEEESDYDADEELDSLTQAKSKEIITIKVVSNDKCLVCLTEYEEDDICRKLRTCGHFFHRECIDQWLTSGRNSCPLCRKKGVAVKKKNLTTEATTSTVEGSEDSETRTAGLGIITNDDPVPEVEEDDNEFSITTTDFGSGHVSTNSIRRQHSIINEVDEESAPELSTSNPERLANLSSPNVNDTRDRDERFFDSYYSEEWN